MSKLRDVICHQKWEKTINQLPKVDEIFDKLSIGIVEKDLFGFARGKAVRGLISAVWEREDKPIVYFDSVRHYPQFLRDLNELLDRFGIEFEDIEKFDPDFFQYFFDRTVAGIEVMETKKPFGEDWESWPLNENPIWQRYTKDWDDYQGWLDKKRPQN